MSIVKQTKDIYGKGEGKKEKGKYDSEKIIDTVLLISIIISSFNITYWTVPLFLSVIFFLKYLRKVINHNIKLK